MMASSRRRLASHLLVTRMVWISCPPSSLIFHNHIRGARRRLVTAGNTADAAAYTLEFEQGKKAYHTVFYNASTHDYGRQQTANTMPLYLGAVPAELQAEVATVLADNIKIFGSISTGGVGARWILQALTAANRTADALSLATVTTQPSWGHFATTPPGTFWENWQQTSGSFNHIMYVPPAIYHVPYWISLYLCTPLPCSAHLIS